MSVLIEYESVITMAMNFKVLENEHVVAEYVADILRKQFNNNPTTIAGLHLAKENAPVLDELKECRFTRS